LYISVAHGSSSFTFFNRRSAEGDLSGRGDCHDFLKTLGEACRKARFEVYAYCLMRNHFHLVVQTPDGNLVERMRWLLSTYSNRFNHRHRLCRHLFSGRYKALLVEEPEQWKGMRRGWCLGSDGFRQRMLERMKAAAGHPGQMRRAVAQARGEGIIAGELRRANWTETELARRGKSDATKLAVAARLRQETTLTVEEVACRLRTGTRNTLSAKLKEWRRRHG
jgi:REP element-mobilizing transposase RayT